MAKLYDWGDGRKIHTISKAQHDKNVAKAQAESTLGRPPLGTYDPLLDAQERASGRSLTDLTADVNLGRERGATDLGLGSTALATQRRQLGEDYGTNQAAVETGYGRSLSDLLKAREQGTQDYGSNINTLERNYTNLGVSQGEHQRAAGAFGGSGAALQSARKREANQAIDRAPIDTAYQRFMADSQTAEGRLGEDKATSLASLLTQLNRGNAAIDTSGAQMGVDYGRGMEDLTTQLTRAQRENTEFGIDTNAARIGQYLQNVPGGRLPVIRSPEQQAATAARQAAAKAKAAHDAAVAKAKKKVKR